MKYFILLFLSCCLLSCSDSNNINLNKQINVEFKWTHNAYCVVKKNFKTIAQSCDSVGTVFAPIPNIEYDNGDFIEIQIYSLGSTGQPDYSQVTASIIVDGYKVRTSTKARYATVYY